MSLKDKINNIVSKQEEVSRGDVMRFLDEDVSEGHVSRILKKLVSEKEIFRIGGGRYTKYVSKNRIKQSTSSFHKRIRNKEIEEHFILTDVKEKFPYIEQLQENIQSIFDYGFSEMVNNAIEHSKSKYIEVTVRKTFNDLSFIVDDFGIGVFRNVQRKRGLKSELEAIQDLLKGKTTTAPQAHSGEGIFFTSKTADIFILESFGHRLTVDNKREDVFIEEYKSEHRGTKVIFTISRESERHLSDIFKEYQTDPGEYAFDKTKVRVSLYTLGTFHVSRSQARRLLSGLNKFKTVVLDFDKVPTIGQAFADEVFRVFQQKNPDIKLEPVNVNNATAFMIKRAQVTER